MKRIIVTGTNSKLGKAFKKYMEENVSNRDYEITSISLRGESWKGKSLCQYDTILHCAGVYHGPADDYEYYRNINVELSKNLAQKAIDDGVKQLIYLSTMDVYNMHEDGCITKETVPNPQSLYGRSKLEAEAALEEVCSGTGTKLAIIRCCPVIGKEAESQMQGYMKAFRFPVFPLMHLDEKRSILHVDTLCNLIRMIVDNRSEGIFFPQNLPPLSVGDILLTIKKANGMKTVLLKFPRKIWIQSKRTKEIFGSFYYDPSISKSFEGKYQTFNSTDAIMMLYK